MYLFHLAEKTRDEELRKVDHFSSSNSILINVFQPRTISSVVRPALMGTKNLYENGPDPFFLFFFDLMGTRMVQIRIAKSV